MDAKVRFESIDFLRFLAAFSVLLFHLAYLDRVYAGHSISQLGILAEAAKYGYLGVDAFFMVSGFVILQSATGKSAIDFSISRIVRLYPAYWFACLFLYFVSCQWPTTDFELNAVDLMENLTMFHGFFGVPHVSGVFWTLTVELNFYLLIIVLILTGLIRHIKYILLLWVSLAVMADYVAVPEIVKSVLILNWCQYFVAGAAFYLVHREGLCVKKTITLLLALFYALKHGYWYLLLKERLGSVDFDPLVMAAVLVALFMLFLLVAQQRLPGNYKTLGRLGVLTYPLYLIHSTVGGGDH